jgi:hypothetical protein
MSSVSNPAPNDNGKKNRYMPGYLYKTEATLYIGNRAENVTSEESDSLHLARCLCLHATLVWGGQATWRRCRCSSPKRISPCGVRTTAAESETAESR